MLATGFEPVNPKDLCVKQGALAACINEHNNISHRVSQLDLNQRPLPVLGSTLPNWAMRTNRFPPVICMKIRTPSLPLIHQLMREHKFSSRSTSSGTWTHTPFGNRFWICHVCQFHHRGKRLRKNGISTPQSPAEAYAPMRIRTSAIFLFSKTLV